MAKIYSKIIAVPTAIQPKKETVNFILNYSKALSYLNIKGQKIEFIAN